MLVSKARKRSDLPNAGQIPLGCNSHHDILATIYIRTRREAVDDNQHGSTQGRKELSRVHPAKSKENRVFGWCVRAALYKDSEWRRGPLQHVQIANRCATIFPHKDGYMPQFMPLTPDKPWLVSMRTLYTNSPPIRVQHARLPSERSPGDQPPYRPAFSAQSKQSRNSLKPWVKP